MTDKSQNANGGVTRTDYEKEKIAALMREYFKRRAETVSLQAEIETKYPKVAEKLRSELPDMKALHEDAEKKMEAMSSEGESQTFLGNDGREHEVHDEADCKACSAYEVKDRAERMWFDIAEENTRTDEKHNDG